MEIILEDWIKDNLLKVEFQVDNFLKLEGVDKIFYILPFKEKLFSDNCLFKLTDGEIEEIESFDEQNKLNLLFQFGGNYYYCPAKKKKDEYNEEQYIVELIDFIYLGKADVSITFENVLGIHSEYEILNSALNFNNAIEKAKFLGVKKLGICDKNTLGGSLAFQLQCKKKEIKPIIGETITVAYDYDENKKNQITHELKLYCTSEAGWFNLLNINKLINVDFKGGFIPEEKLLELSKDLICVFDYNNSVLRDLRDDREYEKIIKTYSKKFHSIYYQISSVEYSSDTFDLSCLNGFKHYLSNHYNEDFKFVLIDDVYYLEKNQSDCKTVVNDIAKKVYQHSYEQYFKTYTEIHKKLEPLFESSSIDFTSFMNQAIQSTNKIVGDCDFEIPLEGAKLPKYEMEGQMLETEESNEMLRMICEEGFEQKIKSKFEDRDLLKEYRKRLEREFQVIIKGNLSDYFLILWDVVNFAKENNVMVGTGRGSIGGSLLAYLIGITRIDPIKYDLLFERFLNESRILPDKLIILKLEDEKELRYKAEDSVDIERGKVLATEIKAKDKIQGVEIKSVDYKEVKRGDQMPDIDIDFCAANRDEIKAYLKNKYGNDYTCSVGTYGRLKLRQTFKDLAKIEGISFQDANDLTKKIDEQIEYEFFDLFKYALKDDKLYKFLQSNPQMINKLKVVLNNPKSLSVHPSAVLVLPKMDLEGRERNLDNWLPIREVNGIKISEWEGKYCDVFGLLKNDILGLSQLDKFTRCLDLIKKNRDKEIDLDEINLEDEKTFRLFQKGWNEDIFQFGSRGLKNYSKEVLPDCIEDLIAMNALYRPGGMASNAHKDYAAIKHGKKKPEYDFGMRGITEPTHGLYIYQEQIMAVFVEIGFTLVEADKIRTAMKKFDSKGMKLFKDEFIEKYKKLLIELK